MSKIKAVIMKPDRENDVLYIKDKNLEGRTFKHKKNTYFIDANRFQMNHSRFLGIGPKQYYPTYYYTEGVSNPLPVPDFGRVEERPPEGMTDGTVYTYPERIDDGVSAEELAAIFNPWFYRVIASQEEPWYKELQFWLTAGVAVAMVYVIFLMTGLQQDVDLLKAALKVAGGS